MIVGLTGSLTVPEGIKVLARHDPRPVAEREGRKAHWEPWWDDAKHPDNANRVGPSWSIDDGAVIDGAIDWDVVDKLPDDEKPSWANVTIRSNRVGVAATPKTLSPSAFDTWKKCPARYWFRYVLGLPDPTGLEAALGTFIHAVLEVMRYTPPEDIDPALIKQVAAEEWARVFVPEPAAQAARDRWPELKQIAWEQITTVLFPEPTGDPLVSEGIFGVDVVAAEWHIKVDLVDRDGRRAPFSGKIDLLLRVDGQLVIVDYKGLALDTPLPTPDGWTTMGDVAVGDRLFDAAGQLTTVVAKSEVHDRPCYSVRFDDGETITCDDEHLWNVGVAPKGSNRYVDKTLNTPEIAALLTGSRVRVVNARPLDAPAVELPVDPYVLGAWLGDGARRGGAIYVGTTDLDAMLNELARRGETQVSVVRGTTTYTITPGATWPDLCSRGHGPGHWPASGRRHCRACAADRAAPRLNSPLAVRLRDLGVLNDKHVPAAYLRSSTDQRLELLRGLMDTDGHWSVVRRQAVFCNTNPALVAAVEELVSSLGWRHYTFCHPHTGASYVHFRPVGANPFSLPRKAALVAPGSAVAGRRMVIAVEPVPSVPTQCIVVDSPTSTFLCGRRMVPTHNSGAVPGPRFRHEKLAQPLLYVAAVEAVTGERPQRASLWYTGYDTLIDAPVAQVDQAVADFVAAWHSIQADLASGTAGGAGSAGPLCSWCPYWKRCPTGLRYLDDEIGLTDAEQVQAYVDRRAQRKAEWGEVFKVPPALAEMLRWPREWFARVHDQLADWADPF